MTKEEVLKEIKRNIPISNHIAELVVERLIKIGIIKEET